MTGSRGVVVVVGSFNVDHVWSADTLPLPGQTLAGTYRSGPGGKGFNQAVASARSGAATTFVCALGADVGGQLARALATADGIDLRDAASDAPTGTAGIYVDADGRNSIIIGPGANATLDAAHVQAQGDALARAGVLLAQLESPIEAVLHALQAARGRDALALLNPAPANAPTTPALLATCDVLTPNETEFAALLHQHAGIDLDPTALASVDHATLHAHCRALLPHGSVVVTLGAAGCFVSHAERELRGDGLHAYRVTAPAVDAVDTTGAGDAFNGALASSLAQRPEAAFRAHVEFAVAYASESVRQPGAAAAMPYMRVVDASPR